MKRVTIVLPEEIADEVQRVADDEATPFSVLVRRWIVERLRQMRREDGQ